jgi:hemerythrin-like domain-containing protein
MLRDKSLIPLSHQHQRALALCVRIDRARPIPVTNLESWQAQIELHFEADIKMHCSAEERVVFPAARRFPELDPLIDELLADHAALRKSFSSAARREMSAEDLPSFAQQLSVHIRKEERLLFERLQRLIPAKDLAALGIQLQDALKEVAQSCVLTSEATKLRPRR